MCNLVRRYVIAWAAFDCALRGLFLPAIAARVVLWCGWHDGMSGMPVMAYTCLGQATDSLISQAFDTVFGK